MWVSLNAVENFDSTQILPTAKMLTDTSTSINLILRWRPHFAEVARGLQI
ncbi:MAG: hypothetical protein ACI9HK_003450, partial [Pirellulaceae bacterium]